jgi:hypothetical protein
MTSSSSTTVAEEKKNKQRPTILLFGQHVLATNGFTGLAIATVYALPGRPVGCSVWPVLLSLGIIGSGSQALSDNSNLTMITGFTSSAVFLRNFFRENTLQSWRIKQLALMQTCLALSISSYFEKDKE